MRTPSEGRAVGWTATVGLVPGYGHDNLAGALDARRMLLIDLWHAAMETTLRETGFTVSCVISPSTVLYRLASGCPEGGEAAVTISGSSNPAHVPETALDLYEQAVLRTIALVQEDMEQATVRIEFHDIRRSVYSRIARLPHPTDA